MKKIDTYPLYIPFLRNLFNISLFSLALYILWGLHAGLSFFYGLYCLAAAFFIMPKLRCTRCFYHKRICSTGFSIIAGKFYKKDPQHTFTEGIWHNICLIPIGLIPLGGALWRMVFWKDSISIWTGILFILILTGLLIEHATLGCSLCHELPRCPARWVARGKKE